MTPETKRSLWSLLRGLLLGLSIGFGVTTNYWAHRVREIARIQQSVQRQLDSVQRVCAGEPPMRGVSYK